MNFQPKHMERYWYITDGGRITDSVWGDTTNDQDRYEYGNIYRSDREAMSARNKMKSFLKTL